MRHAPAAVADGGDHIGDGDVFRWPRQAIATRAAALATLLATGMAWLITMLNGPGKRLVRFGLTDQEIVLAIVGMIIRTTGSVMAEATRIAEENRQIV